ncbi:hypothetical protein TNCV_715351 [Trichonephila clavipes]|nr:hypothetical protein TNCV_715351 [Trichonephila clavipes]
MTESSSFSPGEDSTRTTLSCTFRLISEKNTPILLVSMTEGFSSSISVLSCWLQSNGCTRLTVGEPDCGLSAW